MDNEERSYPLRVRELVRETSTATSIVLEVPEELADVFAFRPGQFLTLAVPSATSGPVARCYSICTPPGEPLTVTVQRTAGGHASNWLNDKIVPGDVLRVLPPAGTFTPKNLGADLLLLAGGSGITPVMSIVRTVLEQGTGRVVLLHANPDERSVIFGPALAALAAAHPDRFRLVSWLDSLEGLPTADRLRAFASPYADWTSFCCGPAPFMKAVADALRSLGVPRARRHQERFVSLATSPFGDVEAMLAAPAETPVRVEVLLDGEQYLLDDWRGTEPLLDFLEARGVPAPYSCREGECSACACRILEGEVALQRNDVLDRADLAAGIRLACQALPVSGRLRVTYDG